MTAPAKTTRRTSPPPPRAAVLSLAAEVVGGWLIGSAGSATELVIGAAFMVLGLTLIFLPGLREVIEKEKAS